MTAIAKQGHGGLELLASLERLGAATPTSLELPENLSYALY